MSDMFDSMSRRCVQSCFSPTVGDAYNHEWVGDAHKLRVRVGDAHNLETSSLESICPEQGSVQQFNLSLGARQARWSWGLRFLTAFSLTQWAWVGQANFF